MSLVVVTELDRIAYVKLNRPDLRNAFNPEMIKKIEEIFSGLNQRKDLSAVALTGEGSVFCAGADLNWMKAMVKYSLEQNRQDSLDLFNMFESLARCRLPILGLVQGAAIGGALGLISCCDYVIAEDNSQFCFSEVKLGLVPAVISPFVARKVHLGLVRPWMLSGQIFSAAEAHRIGMVQELVPAGKGLTLLPKKMHMFLDSGPDATKELKKLLFELPAMNWEQQKERTTRLIAEMRVGSEGQEGIKSFLEKRDPAWRDH
jgi:methylglutaconyl-CoA hydratase